MTTMTEQATQVYAVFIRATPEQVWDAITKPEFTTKYFYGTKIESSFEPGTPYLSVAGDRDETLVDGEIVESDPPRMLDTRGARSTTRRPRRSRTAASRGRSRRRKAA